MLSNTKGTNKNNRYSVIIAVFLTVVFLTIPLAKAEVSDTTGRSGDDEASYDNSFQRRVVTTGYFKGSDGKPVRYRKYAHLGHDKATVVFLNGRAEFIEKYDVLFSTLHEYPVGSALPEETLTDLPVTFITLDHEGQGKSQQQPGRLGGHIDNFDSYVKDVALLFKAIPELRKHTQPTFMMSHSMGGLIAARFVQKYPRIVDGLIFSSPMFGFAGYGGITPEQLEPIVAFYAAPTPYGLNMPKLCSNPDGVDKPTLGAIAGVHSNPGLKACFDNPSSGGNCSVYTQCLLVGLPNNCGLPAIDFAGLNGALQYLRALPEGCPARNYAWDPELTDDVLYGTWSQAHPLHGREPTVGWFNQGFIGQHDFANGKDINLPTLMLVDRNDKVIAADKAIQELAPVEEKVICSPKFNPATCDVRLFDGYQHELFGTLRRAEPLLEVRNFLKKHLKRFASHGHGHKQKIGVHSGGKHMVGNA